MHYNIDKYLVMNIVMWTVRLILFITRLLNSLLNVKTRIRPMYICVCNPESIISSMIHLLFHVFASEYSREYSRLR